MIRMAIEETSTDVQRRPLSGLLGLKMVDRKTDILSTISNLSGSEIFTPPELANAVLDLFPSGVWSDPAHRFLDPCCKTGVFLREIVKRLMAGLEAVIPDAAERRSHVLRNQVFGIAITELTWLMTRRTLYGTKDATSDRAAELSARMDRPEGNVAFPRAEHSWDARGRCRICGISYEIEREGMDNHAYAFIHDGSSEIFPDMRFDTIIGNPPYQVKDGGHGASATPIYQLFVQAAKEFDPRHLSMIIPARWYAGGKGLDGFRAEMLSDPGLSKLVDIRDASEAFAGVEIKGGICYFLRETDRKDPGCEVRGLRGGALGAPMKRRLDAHDVLIRENEAVPILEKVLAAHDGPWLSEKVSSQKPFGFRTNFTDFSKEPFEGAIRIYANGGSGWIERDRVPDENGWVDRWKVLLSMAYNGGDALPHQIMGRPIISEPGSCCTETYIVVGSFETEGHAKNLDVYMRSRMVRFLISLRKNTQHLTRHRFSFVPDLPMDELWTDEKLYDKFSISRDERKFIENMVKGM